MAAFKCEIARPPCDDTCASFNPRSRHLRGHHLGALVPGQAGRQHGSQLVQRVRHEDAGLTAPAVRVGRDRPGDGLARVLGVAGADEPHQPTAGGSGLVLDVLGAGGGQRINLYGVER